MIQNDKGYPTLVGNLGSSLPTSATEAGYKIGYDSTMGHFLYPTSTLASETYKIIDRFLDYGNKVGKRTIRNR